MMISASVNSSTSAPAVNQLLLSMLSLDILALLFGSFISGWTFTKKTLSGGARILKYY